MVESLAAEELYQLVNRVFMPQESDQALAVLVDLPDDQFPDTPAWSKRRDMALGWVRMLNDRRGDHGIISHLVLFRNSHTNNADLPQTAWIYEDGLFPKHADDLDPGKGIEFATIFQQHTMFLAPTQLSVTAPMKIMAKQYGFRAATMPGFSETMIPALRLDYQQVNRRVRFMKDLLDNARMASFIFRVDDREDYTLCLDLRYRSAHASGGLFHQSGMAGNLPSGEAFIVPYEGERPGEPSQSNGELPVEIENDVVVFHVRQNRAERASGQNKQADEQNAWLAQEPAYGNMAELGLGVLMDFGIQATGETLLDEKLGLHIAFGRSDHFGGQVGAGDFSRPDAVVHLDRVYIEQIQPRIRVAKMELDMREGYRLELMRDNHYVFPERWCR